MTLNVQLSACGTWASKAARRDLGAREGSLLQVTADRGETIHRTVHKVPRELLAVVDDHTMKSTLWVEPYDMRLLGIAPGDSVDVQLSDADFDMP